MVCSAYPTLLPITVFQYEAFYRVKAGMSIQIIPVIDLKDGIAVHARKGNRDAYQPLQSKLCPSSDIFQIVETLAAACRSDIVYLADLNAITHQGDHDPLLKNLLTRFPKLTFWIDRGTAGYGKTLMDFENHIPVLGSESFRDDYPQVVRSHSRSLILSLDFLGPAKLGPEQLFDDVERWPDDIIIMTLNRVGSESGPDLEKLAGFRQAYPDKNFIAAGGIRNRMDLAALANIGVRQVLVASALHDLSLSADEIAEWQAKKYPG